MAKESVQDHIAGDQSLALSQLTQDSLPWTLMFHSLPVQPPASSSVPGSTEPALISWPRMHTGTETAQLSWGRNVGVGRQGSWMMFQREI